MKPEFPDTLGLDVLHSIRDFGITGVETVRTSQLYLIDGELGERDARQVAEELLVDPVVHDIAIVKPGKKSNKAAKGRQVVQVTRRPGVMDPVEASVIKGAKALGLELARVKTGRRFFLSGSLDDAELAIVAKRVLANEVIEDVAFEAEPLAFPAKTPGYKFRRVEVPIFEADDEALMALSHNRLWLNLEEMKTIQEYYKKLGRNPSDAELETIAQTWSEHCVHKTFRGLISYNNEPIDSLLKTYIAKVTEELNKPWCLSVFEDNAGVIAFDDEDAVCFKVETHNHPSALEPYGGAGTGTGGVIRDPLGTGLGARPVANTDVFCFGGVDYPLEKLPKGTLHPRRIMKGVVSGVRDYGNRMGIPTINGAIVFDDRYVGNPLVYCGTVGIMPRDKVEKQPRTGDVVLLVGGRTGRDGIHGVTFASGELTDESERVSGGAVQIGDPITEKKMVDTIIQARDRGLYNAITDCGGGGLSSAVGEMGEELGVEVDIEKIPLKYEGLEAWEVWISEAQERMILSVSPGKLDEILAVFAAENVEATVIGNFTGTKRLVLRYEGNVVCDLDMEFLHKGVPQLERVAKWSLPEHPEPELPLAKDFGSELHGLLSDATIASKEWVIRQYDHEVQAGSAIKPLVGVENDGPGDASVIAPKFGSSRGVVVACGLNPFYSDIDAYHMAASAIDEAMRNVISVGGTLERCAILDNFSWGNPNKPDRLGSIVRACMACYDVAKGFGTPFVSGKDSLNNEYAVGDETIVIPGTLLISAISVIEDVSRCITMDLKAPGNRLYMVGITRNELGASAYYRKHGYVGNAVPTVEVETAKQTFNRLSAAIGQGLVNSCHDLSEGGLAVAMAEMAFAGNVGASVDLSKIPAADDAVSDEVLCFSESNSRLIVEVTQENSEAFEKMMEGSTVSCIGDTNDSDNLTITGLKGDAIIKETLSALKESWKKPLAW
jgi:phosphoribosylformylglycinamidine synthase